MSAILYYGPGAEQDALAEAQRVGRLLAPPFGSEGLKVDGAREAVALLGAPPVGDRLGVIVIGKMDEVNPQAADVLLKSIEEFDPRAVLPILWARDLGGVPDTIRSRCLDRWSHADLDDDEPLYDLARRIVDLHAAGDIARLVILFQQEDLKKREADLLAAMARCLISGERSDLWLRLRPVASYNNLTAKDILSALLEGIK